MCEAIIMGEVWQGIDVHVRELTQPIAMTC